MLRFTRWDAPPGFVVGRCDLGGALMIANAQGDDTKTIYRDLLIYAGGVVLVAPLLAWLLFVPTGLL